MSIKKSSLEKKWYYRVAKVVFIILPFFVGITLVLKGYMTLPEITSKNIQDVLQKNIIYIVYIIGGLILYYLLLNLIWRGLLYIIFGGLENDIKKPVVASVQTAGETPTQKKDNSFVVATIIIILCLIFAYFIYPASSNLKNKSSIINWIESLLDKNHNSTCVPTGCGTGWWCSGSYYIGGQEINVPGLCYPTNPRNVYPSWSGTCRQCP